MSEHIPDGISNLDLNNNALLSIFLCMGLLLIDILCILGNISQSMF